MSIFDRIINMFFSSPESKDKETPGDIIPVPIEQKPFKQYISVMINSITLSSEMDKLFLIDNGRAIDFPLDGKNGVLIGTLQGQITVATAFELPKEASGEDPEGPKKLVLPVARFQWTLSYNKPSRSFIVIGATDVTFSALPDSPDTKSEGEAQFHLFDLTDKVVNIRRVGEQIELIEMTQEKKK